MSKNPFDRYPQAEGAHPETPWWRGGRTHDATIWNRGDWRVRVSHYWDEIRVEHYTDEYIEQPAGAHPVACTLPPSPGRPKWQVTELSPLYMVGSAPVDVGHVAELEATIAEPLLQQIDKEHPMQAPEPRCGQVWLREDEGSPHFVESMVEEVKLGVDGEWIEMMFPDGWGVIRRKAEARGEEGWHPWPPGLLISGPGAPWAPPDWEPPKRVDSCQPEDKGTKPE